MQETDTIDLVGVDAIAPGSTVEMVLHHADGSEDRAELRHSLTAEQIAWLRAGSALNLIRERS